MPLASGSTPLCNGRKEPTDYAQNGLLKHKQVKLAPFFWFRLSSSIYDPYAWTLLSFLQSVAVNTLTKKKKKKKRFTKLTNYSWPMPYILENMQCRRNMLVNVTESLPFCLQSADLCSSEHSSTKQVTGLHGKVITVLWPRWSLHSRKTLLSFPNSRFISKDCSSVQKKHRSGYTFPKHLLVTEWLSSITLKLYVYFGQEATPSYAQ